MRDRARQPLVPLGFLLAAAFAAPLSAGAAPGVSDDGAGGSLSRLTAPEAPARVTHILPRARFVLGAPAQLETRRTRNGHLLVKPRLNGKDVGWFIFDTGSSQHVVAAKAARRAGLERVGTAEVRSLTGSSEGSRWRADSLRLGPAVFADARLAETDLTFYNGLIGFELAGILGFEILQSAVVEYDHLLGRIRLHDPGEYEPPSATWSRLVSRNVRPRIHVDFERHREVMLVDTGANGNAMFYTPTVERLRLLSNRRTRSVRTSGLHGPAKYQEGNLRSIELGGMRFENRPVLFAATEKTKHTSADPAGLLGCDLFLPFVLVFDYSRGRLGFVRRDEPRLSADELEAFAGTYRVASSDFREVGIQDGVLVSRRNGGPAHRLRPLGGDRFYYEDALAWCEFERDSGGKLRAMELHRPGRSPERASRYGGGARGAQPLLIPGGAGR